MNRETTNFDLARLLFALLIVNNHLLDLAGPQVWEGFIHPHGVGLDGLFVITGFLVYRSWCNEKQLLPFFIRRFFRIYPTYIVVVATQCFVLIYLNGTFDAEEAARYLAVNAVFLNFLQPTIGSFLDELPVLAINGSLWAMKVVVGFYILLPALAVLTNGNRIWVLVAIFAASFAYFVILKDIHHSLAFQIPGRLYMFGLGVLFCMFHTRIRKIDYCILFAVATALHLAPAPDVLQQIGRDVAVAAGSMVIAFVLPHVRIRRDLTFGIFLVHFPTIQLLLAFGIQEHLTFYEMLTVTIVVSAVLAYGLSVAIERPGIDFGQSLIRNLRNAPER